MPKKNNYYLELVCDRFCFVGSARVNGREKRKQNRTRQGKKKTNVSVDSLDGLDGLDGLGGIGGLVLTV